MKFKNQEAYVYGETQLIYFSDIREHLKNGQEIELVLYDVDDSNSKKINDLMHQQMMERQNGGPRKK